MKIKALILGVVAALLSGCGRARRRERRRRVGERRLRLHRNGGGQLLRRRAVHVERADPRRRKRARAFNYTQVRDGVAAHREGLADVRVDRGRPRVGRRHDRVELAREPRRAGHVVPGARLRRGRRCAAGHVVDARRGTRRGRRCSTASTIRPSGSRSSSSRGTCRCGAASTERARAAGSGRA